MPLDGKLYEDEILRVLRDAQERIRDPENWITSPRAKTQAGDYLGDGSDPKANQWCALGAVDWAVKHGVLLDFPAVQLLAQAAVEMGFTEYKTVEANWAGYDTCHAMFDRAQELRRAEIMETVEVTP